MRAVLAVQDPLFVKMRRKRVSYTDPACALRWLNWCIVLRGCRVRWAMVKSVTKSPIGNGDLIDDHAWSVLLASMRNEITDGVLLHSCGQYVQVRGHGSCPRTSGVGWSGLARTAGHLRGDQERDQARMTWLCLGRPMVDKGESAGHGFRAYHS